MLIGRPWECIGQTPLIYIQSLSEITGCEIYGKAEFLNPGGSIKDRTAKGMIEAAEKEKRLRPGMTLVEGTAGNTGIGLAMLARSRGYRLIICMPDNQAKEKIDILQAYGAEVRTFAPCPFKDENHFYHQARRLGEQEADFFWLDQFENPANGEIHYQTTGPELESQMKGQIDVLTLAVGTGGTVSGVSRYLKHKSPYLEVVLADPLGSGLYHYVKSGEIKSEGKSVTEGIGIMRITHNFSQAKIDDAIQIPDLSMLSILHYVAINDGLWLGSSSGINLWAAYQIGKKYQNKGKRIVTFLCDHGSRYQSKIYDSDWLKTNGLTVEPLLP